MNVLLTVGGSSERWLASRFSISNVGMLNSEAGMPSSILSNKKSSVTDGKLHAHVRKKGSNKETK